jgi:hypothetical protein
MYISCIIKGTGKEIWLFNEDWSYGRFQGSYSHEEDVKGLYFSMGNVEIE